MNDEFDPNWLDDSDQPFSADDGMDWLDSIGGGDEQTPDRRTSASRPPESLTSRRSRSAMSTRCG
ncbi:MAG: hypothetical protein HND48_05685 [Chloroflexi bacterium]|nr:hypothetical protein [Chloroflexota bacterium]